MNLTNRIKQALREHEQEEKERKKRPPLRTLDDIRQLSREEVLDRMDEVDAVLTGKVPPEAGDDE